MRFDCGFLKINVDFMHSSTKCGNHYLKSEKRKHLSMLFNLFKRQDIKCIEIFHF